MVSKNRTGPRKRPVKYYSAKRRAAYERGDCIDRLLLFELHNWKCWVCKESINRYIRFPNYMAATIEHVVPLSKGGTHTWDNTVPAHAKCNWDKGDALPDEWGCAAV